MKKVLILLVIASSFLTSCYYNNEEDLYPTPATNDTTIAKYSTDVQPIISANCAISGCHVTGATFPDFTTYQGVFNNRARIRIRINDAGNPMPRARLMSVNNRTIVNRWIDAGAPNN
jgi:hypothetical protein